MFRASGIDVKYQWLRNGKLLPGATFNVLRFIKINESNEGIYKCVVSNKGGEVEFNPATVTVYGKWWEPYFWNYNLWGSPPDYIHLGFAA